MLSDRNSLTIQTFPEPTTNKPWSNITIDTYLHPLQVSKFKIGL